MDRLVQFRCTPSRYLNRGTVTAVPTAGPNAVIDPGEGGTLSMQLVNSGSGEAILFQGRGRWLQGRDILLASAVGSSPNMSTERPVIASIV